MSVYFPDMVVGAAEYLREQVNYGVAVGYGDGAGSSISPDPTLGAALILTLEAASIGGACYFLKKAFSRPKNDYESESDALWKRDNLRWKEKFGKKKSRFYRFFK